MMILKPYTTTDKWFTYHEGIGNAKYLQLQILIAQHLILMFGLQQIQHLVLAPFFGDNSNDIPLLFSFITGYSKVGDYTVMETKWC